MTQPLSTISANPTILVSPDDPANADRNMWTTICTYLPPVDILSLSRASRAQYSACQQPIVWKTLAARSQRQNLIEEFAPLILDQTITWKEVYQYANLSRFLNRIVENEIERFIHTENPQLEEGFADTKILGFAVKYGNSIFSISNLYDVTIRKIGTKSTRVLKGTEEDRCNLTYLAVQGDFLFCFREDGKIIQWNYRLGQIIQILDTALSKNELRSRSKILKVCVQDGWIAINYMSFTRKHESEIISYLNPSERVKFDAENQGHKIFIKKNKIYFMRRNSIYAFEPKRNTGYNIHTELSSEHFITDIAVENNIIYVTSTNKELRRFDDQSKKMLPSFSLPGGTHLITVIGNLLFTFQNDLIPIPEEENSFQSNYSIQIIDLNNGKLLHTVNNPVIVEQESHSVSIQPHVLPELVFHTRSHLRSLILPPPNSGRVIS